MERTKTNALIWRPTNPHDRFCRHTAYSPVYAPDFLRCYGGPILTKYVDLDHLQEAPTTHLSDELKEVIMDASLTARLLDQKNMSEILMHLEHKSQPSKAAAIQLLTEAALSLRFRWILNNRPESGKFVLPIPLMIIVYNGNEDWDGEIFFQDLFPDLPEELRPFVPQFRIILINLKHFVYGNLPGQPQTQAIVESLKRATDGTFIEHLPSVLQHVANSDLDEHRRMSLTRSIASYCTWGAGANSEQIIKAITTVFRRQEGISMAETVQKSIIQEGIEIGRVEGKVEGKVEVILAVLYARFKSVPKHLIDDLGKMTDPISLDSIAALAATCTSIDEIADALK